MKKLISLALCVVILFSLAALAGCSGSTLNFGVGTYAYNESMLDSLDGDDGKAQTVINIAAVLLDNKGRVVECEIDCTEYELGFSAEGKYLPSNVIVSKLEKGDSYGMKAYGGSEKEWYEQVDAFIEVIKGKTAEEIKALVAEEKKGTDEVINAGCTIAIEEFVKAVERAIENATESNAKKGNTLKIGMVSTQTDCKDATGTEDGVNRVDTTFTAVALDGDKKVTCAYTDALQAEITFNFKGSNTGKNGEVTTKRAAGDNYGMAKYGTDLNEDGVVKEYYEQAAEFDKALVGKDAAGIAKLVAENGYGDDNLQKAGCTIAVSDMVKAAEEAAK